MKKKDIGIWYKKKIPMKNNTRKTECGKEYSNAPRRMKKNQQP